MINVESEFQQGITSLGLHVDLSDESSVREIKIDHTPDPTTQGTPIIFTTNETDEEDFPVPLLTSPTT